MVGAINFSSLVTLKRLAELPGIICFRTLCFREPLLPWHACRVVGAPFAWGARRLRLSSLSNTLYNVFTDSYDEANLDMTKWYF